MVESTDVFVVRDLNRLSVCFIRKFYGFCVIIVRSNAIFVRLLARRRKSERPGKKAAPVRDLHPPDVDNEP